MIRYGILYMFLAVASPSLCQGTLESLGKEDLHQNNHFGQAVALDGDRALIAAPSEIIEGNSYQGAVYVFEHQAEWVETAKLEASNGGQYDYFGQSVAVKGSVAAIGAPGNSAGSVYIFEETEGNWQEAQILKPALEEGEFFHRMKFGKVLAMSEDFLFVTAPDMITEFPQTAGVVFIFERTESGWTFVQRLSSPSDDHGARFGNSLAVDGNRLIIGAPHGNGGAENSGLAYLYELENERWTLEHAFIYPESNGQERFGVSVDIDGDQVIIGSLMHVFDQEEGPVGTAHIFIHSGMAWFHAGLLSSSQSSRNDFFGEAVAIEGDLAIVSAVRSDYSGRTDAGSVHVYRQENGFWTKVLRLVPSEEDLQSHMYLGNAIALSAHRLLLGSPLADNLSNDSGSAFLHDLDQVVSTGQVLPESGYALYPNRPNPFNGTTQINFDLPRAGKVRIQVIDAMGKPVEILTDSHFPAGEGHTLEWQPRNLPGGTYYIQLQTGKTLATIKAIYIR
ncbi:MAG: T9SS type A sorting domain-containing protein [Saprospiraceae bacterium]|nr:T9SS type A sorting domain-containing protein [Saprospiraceae bacterium]